MTGQVAAAPRPVRRRLVRSSLWLLATSGLTLALQLCYTAATSRALGAAAFGAMSLSLTLSGIVSLGCVAGVSNAVARAEHLRGDQLGTALTMSITTSLLGFLLLVAVSLALRASGAASVGSVLGVLAAQPLLAGLAAVPTALLRRELRFRELGLLELAGQAIGFLAGALLAARFHAAWALAVAPVLSAATVCTGAWALVHERPRPAASRGSLRQLGTFALAVTGQNYLHYAIYALPVLALGHAGGLRALGTYNRASALTLVPLQQLVSALVRPLYPAYARHAGEPAALRAALTDALIVASGVGVVGFAALAGLLWAVVPLVLGPEWAEVRPVAAALCLFAGLNLQYAMGMSALEALRRLRPAWTGQAVFGAATLAALATASARGASALQIASALAVAQLLAVVALDALLVREGLLSLGRFLPAAAVHLLLGAAALAAGAVGRWMTSGSATSAAAYAALLVACGAAAVRFRAAVPAWSVLSRLRAG